MSGNNQCKSIDVSTTVDNSTYRSLQVTARCNLNPPFGSALIGAAGPSYVSVTAAMPF
jgi:hypothetical protein